MAVISDIPDGDNGGAPNKKPQEQPGEVETAPSLESLPDVLIEHIIARVPRSNHPELSLVSKLFRRIIASPELRLTRSHLAISEHVLYALLAFPLHPPSWYILNASLRLRRVNTLPPMPSGSAVVTIGHEIYVIGGSNGSEYLTSVTVVDCRTHTCRSLPSMRSPRYRAAAGVIDGKIYVMGGCVNRSGRFRVETFDLERQVWLGSQINSLWRDIVTYDVMKEKIYVLGRHQCLGVYNPTEGTLQSYLGRCNLGGLWQASSCVVDDLLYTIDPGCSVWTPIIVFDPEVNAWKPVKGVCGLPPCLYWYAYESKMANVGGKLVILVGNQSQLFNYYGEKYIWCVEIALERRHGYEIWGKVETVEVVFETTESTTPIIELCRSVIV
ncbi:putative F-box/kelch-repeat protein At2g29810 [Brassica napus]|uniref:putative F-box/kelch-repeat protein At2g29810 n=1 Tax=Brassica napus TaxID=3708 RepID=UPI00207856EA|nr:putative F-box/kelch-repeat protein At2g29810 [Brassica napus]